MSSFFHRYEANITQVSRLNIVWWLHMQMTSKQGRNMTYKNNTLLMVKA